MIATYRLQLQPGFGFDEVRDLLPYFRRLGMSHLYLSPITEARRGSTHGYDVTNHNLIRQELGGPKAFRRLLEAARAAGLALILDFVPNHAGVGARNERWQDVLAYGPTSPYAGNFDIEWTPLKPELKNRILLPYLERPYGECLDGGEITIVFEKGRFSAAYARNRFALAPHTYPTVLDLLLRGARGATAEAVAALRDAYGALTPGEREAAEALHPRLEQTLHRMDPPPILRDLRGGALHALLETQYWRLAFWKTAAHEINYRRFFDINELVALRMEDPEVFRDAHRLLAALLAEPGIEGVRIDHIDGLFDPHGYLARLKALGAKSVWVEKILSRGETLPPEWPVEGTIGYEFLNDLLGLLTWPSGERPLTRIYRQFARDDLPYGEVAVRSKRLVMDTTLAGELLRLAYGLARLAEADYRTRDFTLEALHQALADVVASFPRYRTYLPHDREDAEAVIRTALHAARRRSTAAEPSVFDFIERVLLGQVAAEVEHSRRAWVGRFQQYTAPVAAKGVEDTAFYRYLRLAALNEIGGSPDQFGLAACTFHARNHVRAQRYPRTLLATATHDHKRGEETRMRLAVLAELPESWQRTLRMLSGIARRHRTPAGPSRADEYLFAQTLVAVWEGADRDTLTDRLVRYMQKAVREAKVQTSWQNPDPVYEAAVEGYVRGMTGDRRLADAVAPLARAVARHGFTNGLSQLVLKATSPGIPDFYQGAELLDLSLVDPDNRQPVDFAIRRRLLEDLEPMLARPDPEALRGMVAALDVRVKLYVVVRLLRLREASPALFRGQYRGLETTGPTAEHLVAYAREADEQRLLTLVPRFPAVLERRGWGGTVAILPDSLAGRTWTEMLTGIAVRAAEAVAPEEFPLPWAVLVSGEGSPAASAPAGV